MVTVERKEGSRTLVLIPILDNFLIPKEILKDQSRQYSPGLNSVGEPPRGLTFDEELEFLPRILGISPTSAGWDHKVWEYWANFGLTVPYIDGLPIEAGFRKTIVGNPKTGEQEEKLLPIDLTGYCSLQILMNDRRVCKVDNFNPAEHDYILVDKEKEKQAQMSAFNMEKANMDLYVSIQKSEVGVETFRTMLIANAAKMELNIGDITSMTPQEVEMQANTFRSKFPVPFNKAAKDSASTKVDAFIKTLLSFNVLTKDTMTDQYVFGEEIIGNGDQLKGRVKNDNEFVAKLTTALNDTKALISTF